MSNLIEYMTVTVMVILTIAAPFAGGFILDAMLPGMGGIGIMAGFGFGPVLFAITDKMGV